MTIGLKFKVGLRKEREGTEKPDPTHIPDQWPTVTELNLAEGYVQ
jgi:hypothetical protein